MGDSTRKGAETGWIARLAFLRFNIISCLCRANRFLRPWRSVIKHGKDLKVVLGSSFYYFVIIIPKIIVGIFRLDGRPAEVNTHPFGA